MLLLLAPCSPHLFASTKTMTMRVKGAEIARCLGYQHTLDEAVDSPEDGGSFVSTDGKGSVDIDNNNIIIIASPAVKHDGAPQAPDAVDMLHLRSLAIQPGGLLNSNGRKLGWTKLAGVDELVFQKDGAPQGEDGDDSKHEKCRSSNNISYEHIQKQLEQEMEPSKWHIQRERRRLRKSTKGKRTTSSHHHYSSTASRASSTNDLSSIGSGQESGSSTPLTANLNSYAGTPKSVTFQGLGPVSASVASSSLPVAGVTHPSFTIFPSSTSRSFTTTSEAGDASSTTSFASFPSISIDTTFDDNSALLVDTSVSNQDTPSTLNTNNSNGVPSPLSLASPSPQCQASTSTPTVTTQFQWNLTPKSYLQHQQKYAQRTSNTKHHNKIMKSRIVKKDRRPQERKFLVQIASSAFYALAQKQQEDGKGVVTSLQYYDGLQDIIAILLLHLESPSLASLVLKQILESHLWMYCLASNDNGDDDESSCRDSFTSCVDDAVIGEQSFATNLVETGQDDSFSSGQASWDLLSLSFFPLLQAVDIELHDSLLQINGELSSDLMNDCVLIVAKVLHGWISSWFCCHDSLPLVVVSRLVDFFLASHPAMPLYLSVAILSHPANRTKLMSPHTGLKMVQTAQSLPQDAEFSLDIFLENLFSELPAELSSLKSLHIGNDALADHANTDEDGTGLSRNECTELDDNNELIGVFIEEAISKAVCLIKQAQPHSLNSLANGYQDGLLLPFLNPKENQQWSVSPSSWTNRLTAPSDYMMVRNMIDGTNNFTKQCSIPRDNALKYQVALDASGLPPIQLRIQSPAQDCMFALKNTNVLPKAVILGIVLGIIGPQLIQLDQTKSTLSSLSSVNTTAVDTITTMSNSFVINEVIENLSSAMVSAENDTIACNETPTTDIDGTVNEYAEEVFEPERSVERESSNSIPMPTLDDNTDAFEDILELTEGWAVQDTIWLRPPTSIDWPTHAYVQDNEAKTGGEKATGTQEPEGESIGETKEKAQHELEEQKVDVSDRLIKEEAPQHVYTHNFNEEHKEGKGSGPSKLNKLNLGIRIKRGALGSLAKFKNGCIALVEDDDFFM